MRARCGLRWLLSLGVICALSQVERAAVAKTSDDQRARSLFEAAERHFNMGRFREALGGYRAAYAIRPLPGLLFNVAQCYRNLGQCREAVFFFRRFLHLDAKSAYAEDVRRIIASCERTVAAQVGPTSAPAGPRGPTRTKVVGGPAPRERPQAVPEARTNTGRGPLFWSGVALTAALAGAGAVTGALALDRNDGYRDVATGASQRATLRDEGKRLELATNLLWGAAAAAGVATALIYWLGRHRTAEAEGPRPVSAAVSVVNDGVVVGLGGRF